MPRFARFALLVLALACGDDDVPGDDPTEDASVADAGGSGDDGGASETDAGPDPADGGLDDSGAGAVDAAPGDAGPPPDLGGASLCERETIGTVCRDGCAGGYECVDGACLPNSMRPGCGGFAGATCDTRAFPNCATFVGSDYGPCLDEEEFACACATLPDIFECATGD